MVLGPGKIAVAQRFLGALHRHFRAAQLSGRLHAKLLHALLQPAQTLPQLALAVAESAGLILVAVLALALTLLSTLTLLPALAFLLLLLLAERIVEQPLLLADDIAE